jgi:hypothetical protein
MRQLPLFGPSYNVTPRLKAAMREALRQSPLSREQIVDKMKVLASHEGLNGGRGSTITVANLDAWVSETKPNLISVNLLPLFCHVTNDTGPMRVLMAPLGGEIVDQKDKQLLEWARIEMQAKALAKRRKKVLSEIEND